MRRGRHYRRILGFSLALTLLSAQSTAALDGGVRPLAPEEVAGLDEYSSGTWGALSPDGNYFVYTVRSHKSEHPISPLIEANPPPSSYHDLWLVDTKTDQAQSITGDIGSNSGASWSPDGRNLAFFSDRDGLLGLWVWNVALRTIHRVAPDEVYRAFPWEKPQWLPDNCRVLVRVPRRSKPPAVTDLPGRRATTNSEQLIARAHVVVYDSPGASSGPVASDADDRLSDLAIFDIVAGTVSRVAENLGPGAYKIAPDGTAVAITTRGSSAENSYLRRWDLNLVSFKDGRRRILASGILDEQPMGTWFSWSPDSSEIAYTDIGSQTYKNENKTTGNLYVVSLKEGSGWSTTDVPHPSFGDDWRPPFWNPAGTTIYVIGDGAIWGIDRNARKVRELVRLPSKEIVGIVRYGTSESYASPDRGRSMFVVARDSASMSEGIWRIDIASGKSVRLRESNESFGRYPGETTTATMDASRISYRVEAADRYPNYWVANNRLRMPRQLTHVNSEVFNNKPLGRSQLVEWNSSRGEPLRGVLLMPTNNESRRPYPLIVDVYGGGDPSGALNRFDVEFDMHPEGLGQFLASRGYAVFRPGSILHAGSPMSDIADCVLSGLDAVEKLGFVDSNRLGLIGHSYGGYSALALVVQTTRFRAAIINQGQGNLINYAYRLNPSGATWTNAAEDGQARLGKNLWEDRSRYIENSPLFFLDRVRTPLLIIHGAQDQNTPVYQADQIFAGLKRLGRIVEYVKYLDEGHNIDSYVDNVDFLRRVDAWFAGHM
jgi:dipeptidyl aminopeptidase/acylaminoacyl peptidase